MKQIYLYSYLALIIVLAANFIYSWVHYAATRKAVGTIGIEPPHKIIEWLFKINIGISSLAIVLIIVFLL